MKNAREAFDTLRQGNGANVMAYAIMIDTYSKFEQLREAEMIFKEGYTLHRNDSEPIFAAMMEAYGRAREFDRVDALFTELEKHVTPNQVTYNIVITSLAR